MIRSWRRRKLLAQLVHRSSCDGQADALGTGTVLPWNPFGFVVNSRMVFIKLPVDRRDLLHPASPLGMLQIHHGLERPVKVKGDEGYLLIERFEGIA